MGPHRRLQLLQRRLGARLAAPHHPVDRGQELRAHRRLRPVDGHRRRDPAEHQDDALLPPERRAHAARHHRADDLQDSEDHRVRLDLDHPAAGRRAGHRHAGRGRRAPHAADLDEARRQGRDRDRQGRRAREQHRRRMRFFLFLAVLVSTAAAAQTYPDRPVRIVVGFPPGGSSDTVARVVAQSLAPLLGQPVVVENKPGAGGVIGSDLVAKAAPDGYTLLLATAGHSTAAAMMQKLPFDAVKDFAWITTVTTYPFVIATAADSPIKSLPDLVKKAKASPGKLTYSSAGDRKSTRLNSSHLVISY